MKKPYLKTANTEIRQVVNAETGEVMEEEKKTHDYICETKEEFFMMYAHIEPMFYGFSNFAKAVFVYICFTYRTDRDFEIGGHTRKVIADKIGASAGTVANVLSELKESGALLGIAKGVYRINPIYAFKGGSDIRKLALKAVIKLGYVNNDKD